MEGQVTCRLKALFRVLLQAVANNAIQGRWNISPSSLQVGRVFLQNRAGSIGWAWACESLVSRQRLIQDHAEAENVRPRVGLLSTHLLGRHIAGGAHCHTGAGLVRKPQNRDGSVLCFGYSQFGQTKVQNLNASVAADENVVRL